MSDINFVNPASDNNNSGNNQSRIFIVEPSASSTEYFERNPVPSFSKPLTSMNTLGSGSQGGNVLSRQNTTEVSDDESHPP